MVGGGREERGERERRRERGGEREREREREMYGRFRFVGHSPGCIRKRKVLISPSGPFSLAFRVSVANNTGVPGDTGGDWFVHDIN